MSKTYVVTLVEEVLHEVRVVAENEEDAKEMVFGKPAKTRHLAPYIRFVREVFSKGDKVRIHTGHGTYEDGVVIEDFNGEKILVRIAKKAELVTRRSVTVLADERADQTPGSKSSNSEGR